MVNGASRRSHDSTDELRGKPTSVGAYAGERLSLTGLGKALQGKPRSKPESGNPTFRDCRGARGNVTWSYDRVRAPRLYPDPPAPMKSRDDFQQLPVNASVAVAYRHDLDGSCGVTIAFANGYFSTWLYHNRYSRKCLHHGLLRRSPAAKGQVDLLLYDPGATTSLFSTKRSLMMQRRWKTKALSC